MSRVVELVNDYLVAQGMQDGEIFIHHSGDFDGPHVTLANITPKVRKPGNIKNHFDDLLRVYVLGTEDIQSVLDKKDEVEGHLVKYHLTDEIVLCELRTQSEPIRRNSKQWEWIGVFRVVGCFAP